MAVHTWTVDELCNAVGDALRVVFPDELWIRGEISGLRRSPAGHLYFDLVEPGAKGRGADMKMSIVAFRGPLRGIEAVLAKVGNLRLEDGIEVRIRGRIDYYPPQGRVQFMMNAIDPRYTLGQLAADRDEVLRRLAAEGLLEANKRLSLPDVPLRVGLITSDNSAAYNDFVDELRSSGYPFEIVLADARVQGLDAEDSLAAAFGLLRTRTVDVIALVRGGGARTDLVAFDKELVARAVATAPVPVFVGIGHEIDRSVVDELCHSSLKTPTACAAAVVERVRAFDQRLVALSAGIASHAIHRLGRAHVRVDRDSRQLVRSTMATVRLQAQRLDTSAKQLHGTTDRAVSAQHRDLEQSSARLARSRIWVRDASTKLDGITDSLSSLTDRALTAQSRRLAAAAAVTRASHPDRILSRGFSVTRTPSGVVVRGHAPPDSELITETGSALITSRVVSSDTKEVP